nr:CDP-alcohol phosphatidyltransferase family protein [Maliibacterium massiliense]
MSEKKPNIWDNVWTVPNILSMIRLLLIPLAVYFFYLDWPMAALGVYVFASATDLVDGYIARHYNQISPLGKLLDPLADKLMLITVLWCLGARGDTPMWVAYVVIIKELAMIVGGGFMYKKLDTVVYANWLGKGATATFTVAVILSFFHDMVAPVDTVLMYVALGVSIVAMLFYAYSNLYRGIRGKSRDQH